MDKELTREQIQHMKTLDDVHVSTRVFRQLCDMALRSIDAALQRGDAPVNTVIEGVEYSKDSFGRPILPVAGAAPNVAPGHGGQNAKAPPSNEGHAAGPAPAAAPSGDAVSVPREVPLEFIAWLQHEMPPGTIISSAIWWAPRIYKAMLAASKDANG